MEQERKIDVMIAEACHEEYVDIILDTIEAAAKVRGTGNRTSWTSIRGRVPIVGRGTDEGRKSRHCFRR